MNQSSPLISIIIVPYTDYSMDYQRFFYDSREVLAHHGVEYPFLESFTPHPLCQKQFADTFLALYQIEQGSLGDEKTIVRTKEKTEEYLTLLEKLDNSREILFVEHLWAIEAFAQLWSLLADTRRFPRLSRAEKQIVWIMEPRSKEVEGIYKSRLPEDDKDITHRDMNENGWWSTFSDTVMRFCPPSHLHKLSAETPMQLCLEHIFKKLQFLFLDECPPPALTALTNRDAVLIAQTLCTWLSNKEYVEAVRILQQMEDCFPAGEKLTFLPPAALRAFDAGTAAHLDRSYLINDHITANAAWHPHTPSDNVQSVHACKRFFDTLPPHLQKHVLSHVRTHAIHYPAQTPKLLIDSFASVEVIRPEIHACVLTLTQNHASFITDCMDSVLAQQTAFPVQHIIVDDRSTDDTRQIIYEYAQKHASIHPIFLPSYQPGGKNVQVLFDACRSPFAAICDGDDYFTDPQKLQKQVDFLTANPDCGLCFHPVQVVYEDGTQRQRIHPPLELLPRGVRSHYYLADLLQTNIIQTNSVMYRWRFRDGLPAWFRSDLVPGDWYWHILHAEMGKIGFINEIMGVYRRHKSSVYYSVELDNTVEHRLKHGIKELAFYDAVNTHFSNKYLRRLQWFANGVFADLFNYQLKTDDSTALDEAIEKYPHFAAGFLKEIRSNIEK